MGVVNSVAAGELSKLRVNSVRCEPLSSIEGLGGEHSSSIIEDLGGEQRSSIGDSAARCVFPTSKGGYQTAGELWLCLLMPKLWV